MTITIRITLPDLSAASETGRRLRTLAPLAGPALLAAVDTGGLGLPARLLVHTVLNAAQDSLRSQAGTADA